MNNRPPVRTICHIDAQGNPRTFTAGSDCTEIRETEENGEYTMMPWIEVWSGDQLIARFNQHKLEYIFY